MNNSFGKIYRISTYGESHGSAIGVIIDGCPPGVEIDKKHIQKELDRRKPGQSKITTQRKESDSVEILSGIFNGKSTGSPISLLIKNKDHKTITAEDSAIAAITFLESIIFFPFLFLLDQFHPL